MIACPPLPAPAGRRAGWSPRRRWPLALRPAGLSLVLIEVAAGAIGLGVGTVLPVTTVAIQNAVALHQLGTATASMNFFRSLGGALLVAGFGAILLGGIGPDGARGAAAPRRPRPAGRPRRWPSGFRLGVRGRGARARGRAPAACWRWPSGRCAAACPHPPERHPGRAGEPGPSPVLSDGGRKDPVLRALLNV